MSMIVLAMPMQASISWMAATASAPDISDRLWAHKLGASSRYGRVFQRQEGILAQAGRQAAPLSGGHIHHVIKHAKIYQLMSSSSWSCALILDRVSAMVVAVPARLPAASALLYGVRGLVAMDDELLAAAAS